MPSGSHTPPPDHCVQAGIIADHSERIKAVENRLHNGDVTFAEFKKDMETLTKSVTELSETIKAAIKWVLGTVGTLAAGGIVWAIVQSQHVVAK